MQGAAGGVELPDGLRARSESTLGSDLGEVRLHAGAASAEAAHAVGARAFTYGQDIHFGAGEFAPGSPDGDALIAHEVVHTAQQRSGKVAQTKLEVSQPGDALELEADAGAARILGGGGPMAVSHSVPTVSRTPEEDRAAAAAVREAMAAAHTDAALAELQSAIDAHRTATRGHHSVALGERTVNIAHADYGPLIAEVVAARAALGAAVIRGEIAAIHDLAGSSAMMSALDGAELTGRNSAQHLYRVHTPLGAVAMVTRADRTVLHAEAAATMPAAAPSAARHTAHASYEGATDSAPADAAALGRIADARSHVHVTETAHADVEFINPVLLHTLPVRRGGGPRRTIFGELALLLERQRDAMEIVNRARGGAADRRDEDSAASAASLTGLHEEIASEAGVARDQLVQFLTDRLAEQSTEAGTSETREIDSAGRRTESETSLGRVAIIRYLLMTRAVTPNRSREERADALRELNRLSPTDAERTEAAVPARPTVAEWRRARAAVGAWLARADAAADAGAAHDEDEEAVTVTAEDVAHAQRDPVTVAVATHDYTVRFDLDGGSVGLAAAGVGYNVDRPGGYASGGSATLSDAEVRAAATRVFSGRDGDGAGPDAAESVDIASESVSTWGHNEGHLDSINTWDRAILTFGPGLAAAGVLQIVFAALRDRNRALFDSALGDLGIGLTAGANPEFTVIVPRPAVGEVPVPGAPAPGTHLVGNQAEEFIANDPLLCGAMRHACSLREVQEAMAEEAIDYSVEYALDWELIAVPSTGRGRDRVAAQRVPWAEIIEGVDSARAHGTYAAIADARHGAGNANSLRDQVSPVYQRMCDEQSVNAVAPNSEPRLSPASRDELATMVLATVPSNRRGAFRDAISPTLFDGVGDTVSTGRGRR